MRPFWSRNASHNRAVLYLGRVRTYICGITRGITLARDRLFNTSRGPRARGARLKNPMSSYIIAKIPLARAARLLIYRAGPHKSSTVEKCRRPGGAAREKARRFLATRVSTSQRPVTKNFARPRRVRLHVAYVAYDKRSDDK